MLDFSMIHHDLSHYEDNDLYEFLGNQHTPHVINQNFFQLHFTPTCEEWFLLEEQFMDYAEELHLKNIAIHLPMSTGIDQDLLDYLEEAHYVLAISSLMILRPKDYQQPSTFYTPFQLSRVSNTQDHQDFLDFQVLFDRTQGSAYTQEMQAIYKERFQKKTIISYFCRDSRSKQILATVQIIQSKDYLEIDHLTVAPANRRQGLAKTILHQLFQQANTQNKQLILVTDTDSIAEKLYLSLGFHSVGFHLEFSRALTPDFTQQFLLEEE